MVIIIIRERARDNQQGIILGGFSKYAITFIDRFLDQVGADPSTKTSKTGIFLEDSCSTMVEYRLAVQFIRVQALPKSGFFFQFRYFCAVTGNKWFVVNKNWRHLCIS